MVGTLEAISKEREHLRAEVERLSAALREIVFSHGSGSATDTRRPVDIARAALALPSPAPVDRYAQGVMDAAKVVLAMRVMARDASDLDVIEVAAQRVGALALTAPAGDGALTGGVTKMGEFPAPRMEPAAAKAGCPECGGEGTVPAMTGYAHADIDCPACGGTGKAKAGEP